MAERRTNLEILLSEWGAWKRGETRQFLGYPDRPAFTAERVDRTAWDSSAPNVPLVDDDLRRLDAAIDDLHPDMRIIMAAHYIWAGPVKAKADRLRLSKSLFYFKLDAAHQHVSHVMGGKYRRGYEPILSRHLECVSR